VAAALLRPLRPLFMELKRQFGLLTAVTLIVGQVIAVGIFLTPAGMAKSVVSPFWLLVVWLVVGAMTVSGALCFGELAARYPEAGGIYVYLREGYGKGLAFLYGWTVLLVLDPGLTAIFGVGAAAYLGQIIPMSAPVQTVLAIAIIVSIGSIVIVGARLGANVLKALTVVKVSTLLFLISYGFGSGSGSLDNFTPFFAAPPDMFGALAGGLVGAFFAFAGWWEVTRVAGEINDPQRNVPRALIAGVLILTVLYVLTSAVFMYLVPVKSITSDETFAAQAGEALFGAIGVSIFSLIVIVSVVGTLFAYMMSSPRVYYAMARDGLFFEAIGRLHPRFGTPHWATSIQMVIASILVVTGRFDQIVSYFFFVVLVFVVLAVLGLFRLRAQPHAGYGTPLFPVTPIFFVAVTAVVMFFVFMRDPFNAAIGGGVVLLGVPIYYLFFGRKSLEGQV